MKLTGKNVFLTGAASGIGRALAIQLSQMNCRLALVDYNEQGLVETLGLLKQTKFEPTTFIADVSDRGKLYDIAEQVINEFGSVDMIVNNAGVALGAMKIEDINYDEFEWIFGINYWGTVYGTKAFLPHLQARPEAAVVNISSVFGLTGIGRQGPYCSTKFAVRGFTESLRAEMEDTNVQVVCVHPGGIKTNIARDARVRPDAKELSEEEAKKFEENFITTPEKAAQTILNGIKKGKTRILIGRDARWMSRFLRLFPTWAVDAINRKAKENFRQDLS